MTGRFNSPLLSASMRDLRRDNGLTTLRATSQAMPIESSNRAPIKAATVWAIFQNVTSRSVIYSAEAIIRCHGPKPRT